MLGYVACELGLHLCHFDAEQAFVQFNLDGDVFMRLPRGCGEMSGKIYVVNIIEPLCLRLEASVEVVAQSHDYVHGLGFEQCPAGACAMRLIEPGLTRIVTVVVHVDAIFAGGRDGRRDQFCKDLNRLVSINTLGELRL